MPHIYKETNKQKKIGKNNNEMESNTIKITNKHYKQESKNGRKENERNIMNEAKSRIHACSCKLATKRITQTVVVYTHTLTHSLYTKKTKQNV